MQSARLNAESNCKVYAKNADEDGDVLNEKDEASLDKVLNVPVAAFTILEVLKAGDRGWVGTLEILKRIFDPTLS